MVLTDSKNATKSGKNLEILGNYDARRGEKSVFSSDKITHWISKGAQLSDTVHNLLISKKVISGKKINSLPLKKAIVKEVPAEEKAPAPAPAPVAEAPAAPVVETPAEKPAPVVEEAPAPTEEAPAQA